MSVGRTLLTLGIGKRGFVKQRKIPLVLVLENISAVSIISFLSGRNTVDFGGDFDANSWSTFVSSTGMSLKCRYTPSPTMHTDDTVLSLSC